MAVVVAEGEVRVTGDASAVPRDIANQIDGGSGEYDRAGQGMGKSIFGGVIGAWAAIGGTVAIVDWFKGGVAGASDLNETLSKSSAIFGTYAPAIETFGNNAAKNLGLSKEAAIGAAAGFGDMFTQLGFAEGQASAMSQSTLQMAADLGSFSNLDTADVADRISAAFRGEYDSLQAVIPNINAARVESEAMAATGKTTAASLTAQEKATAVLAIVQKDGARAMGDFAKTSDGAANSAKIVTASMEDQQAKVGGLLLPIWTQFLSFLNTTAIPGFSTVVEWVTKNGETIGLLAGVIAAAVVSYTAITTVMGIFKAFQIASAAANGTLTVTQWALNAAMSANPIGLIVTAIALLVGAIIWVATQTTFFQDAWANVTSFIATAWEWLWGTVLEPIFTAIGAIFTWIYENIILPVVTGIMLYIGIWAAIIVWLWESVISPVFAAIGAVFTWIYETIIMPIVGYITMVITGLGIVFNWLQANVIAPIFAAIGATFQWIWNTIISPIATFINGAITNVGNVINTVFGGIAGFMGAAFQGALSVIKGPINGIIGLVNGAINAINGLSVTIPSWVPVVGGQTWGVNIPTIPMLARGSAFAPDMFIAGENGPELIMGAGGSRVYPADQTRNKLGSASDGGKGGDLNVTVNEARDPLGTVGRLGREWKKWKNA